MGVVVSLYSTEKGEIKRFLSKYYNNNVDLKNPLQWENTFWNPSESADIVGVFMENNDKFRINMWISFDKGFFINVTDFNVDKIIRYLFERYPY